MKTLLLLTVANIKSLARDRAALFWTFFFPVMFVFLFGWIFGGSGNSKISVGFVDQDGTTASRGLHQAFGPASRCSTCRWDRSTTRRLPCSTATSRP